MHARNIEAIARSLAIRTLVRLSALHQKYELSSKIFCGEYSLTAVLSLSPIEFDPMIIPCPTRILGTGSYTNIYCLTNEL